MKKTTLSRFCRSVASAVLLLGTVWQSTTWAQLTAYPAKAIILVVGFSPGGSNDIVARTIAAPLSQELGVPVLVENKVGASGMIGTNFVARANADGYTLMVSSASPLVVTPHTSKSVPYDARNDFAAVRLLGMTPVALAINPKVPAKNLRELIALAHTQQITLSSSGNGGLPHLAIELFKSTAGGNVVHVPYSGAAPAVVDAMAGHVDGVVVDLPALSTQIKDGRLRGIALANGKRSEFLPDLKTSGEQGMVGFVAVNWIGLVAPRKTPQAVIDRLNAAVSRALKLPEVKKRLADAAVQVATEETAVEFDKFIVNEYDKWGKIVRDAKITVGN